ncbi:tRNA pseudouridine(38-40) synthase TruA [Nonlabens sp. Ci31]|jgi:tRNA pseudouridine38-40 synthase|uniref:tRNA pseudouridine(38-40) synthase TruA n=1 Tax=Nonlabens sp. Ci31 TaxID=2608253 RepID=UPI0014639A3B|nr:tRNA pseudouridine(38-40) synthase TruA [Nonlabens sp. Ci31]QJP34234.1 tRNA pseudouridine(38-40) synthase TruA [Nonlabens sp. Ci31]
MNPGPFAQNNRQFFLIKLQYLGFRFHGWQKQPNNIPTVERMVLRTLRYVFDHYNFKVLAAGRTDAKVSVNETWIELFLDDSEELEINQFLIDFNQNLPSDIRALEIEKTNKDFNVIQAPKIKEYIYLFSHGEKFHPFCASMMVYMKAPLDLSLMKEAARLFEGTHDFWSYTYKPSDTTETKVTIESALIEKNELFTASFFPEQSFVFRVKGAGFKRHQVRLMMGMLFDLGMHKFTLEEFKETLDGSLKIHLSHIAPPSGLMLYSTQFQ